MRIIFYKTQFFYFALVAIILLVSCSRKNKVEPEPKPDVSIQFTLGDSILLVGAMPSITLKYQGQTVVSSDVSNNIDNTKKGWQKITVSYKGKDTSFNVFLADKIITNIAGLKDAIKYQKENEVWAVKYAQYGIAVDLILVLSDQDYYFKIHKPNIHIIGIANANGEKPVLYGANYTANGVYATQNFITIGTGDGVFDPTADGFVMDGFVIMSKMEPNKVIYINDKNCTIKNCDIKVNSLFTTYPIEISAEYRAFSKNYAGAIYSDHNISGLVLENLNIEKGVISMRHANKASGNVTMKNIVIDYRGCYFEEEDDADFADYGPIYAPPTTYTKQFNNVKIILSKNILDETKRNAIKTIEESIGNITVEFK